LFRAAGPSAGRFGSGYAEGTEGVEEHKIGGQAFVCSVSVDKLIHQHKQQGITHFQSVWYWDGMDTPSLRKALRWFIT